MNEYEQQANEFLKETGTEFKTEFIKHGLHFEDDKTERDIYLITLKRGTREFKFNFGQSVANSGEYIARIPHGEIKKNQCLTKEEYNKVKLSYRFNFGRVEGALDKNKNFSIPSAYDVLACLTSYDIGSFKDFCDEFGYDSDSRKAEKTYKAVLNEYNNLKILYNDEELLKLGEIQ